jgi:inosine-uridine nucleoside N-ribohydrolase
VSFPPQKPKAIDKLKQAWNENPIGVAIVAAGVMTATAKLLDSIGSYQSKRAYAEEARSRSRK